MVGQCDVDLRKRWQVVILRPVHPHVLFDLSRRFGLTSTLAVTDPPYEAAHGSARNTVSGVPETLWAQW
jgi:hypothetical protein